MEDIIGEEQFITPMKFALLVEKLVHQSNLGYIEAVLQVCEENLIDEEDAGKLINTPLRSKIEAEAVKFNFIKGDSSGRLPV